jgi:acetyl esterase/lipase
MINQAKEHFKAAINRCTTGSGKKQVTVFTESFGHAKLFSRGNCLYVLAILMLLPLNLKLNGQQLNGNQNIYIHDRPVSFNSRLIQDMMGKSFLIERMSMKIKENNSLTEPAPIPGSLKIKYNISHQEIQGRKVWTINPKKQLTPRKIVIYLHGGAYFFNILRVHWHLIDDLVRASNARFIVPDYPLAPEYNYRDVFSFMTNLYEDLLLQYPNEEIILMGDSAGGGLALAFTQWLRDQDRPMPLKLILLSPWLDVSMENPEISEFAPRDNMLDIKWLKKAGDIYSDDLGTKDFRISPIYGDFKDLPTISIFIGTNDILAADAGKLRELLIQKKVPFNYYEYPGMFHVWPALTFLKEAKTAIRQIAGLIN